MIINGDCLIELKRLESESVDAIVTDPPYELGFMGKKWDASGIAYNTDLWRECLRVLKSGGHLLAFGGTRTYHRMAVAIEDAGFEVRDMLEWIYFSGFPKSLNVGKAVDKQGGKNLSWFIDYILKVADEKGISRKELTMLFPSKNGNPTGWLWNKQKTQGITLEQYHKIKDFLGLPFENIEEAEREVVGTKIAGLGSGKTYAFTDSNGQAKKEIEITKGNSEWEGFGTALKPAHEPVIMARKPLQEKTIMEQVLKTGTGAIDIDSCRIPCASEADMASATPQGKCTANIASGARPDVDDEGRSEFERPDISKGRFPANCICTDDALGKDESRFFSIDVWAEKHGLLQFPKSAKKERLICGFNCVKPSIWTNQKEENMERVVSLVRAILGLVAPNLSIGGFGNLQTEAYPMDTISTIRTAISKITKLITWNSLIQQPTSESTRAVIKEAMAGINLAEFAVSEKESTERIGIFLNRVIPSTEDVKNATYQSLLKIKEQDAWQDAYSHHPTHKPVHLMAWLIRLVSRENHVVLDPFMGSGTTGVACKKLGREFIGIELDPEYCKIAQARIDGAPVPMV